MFTTVFIVHRPYFQYPETRDFWTQDMAYEWRTFPHPYTFIHDTTSVLKAYLMELNNVQQPATNIHHTSVGPSHTLEIVPKTQTCTPGSSSSPHGILVMEQCPNYTNVLFSSILKISITLSQAQSHLVHQHQKRCPTLMNTNIYKLKHILISNKSVVPNANMRKKLAICVHHTTHPLHDCKHAWESLAFAFLKFVLIIRQGSYLV